MTDDTPKDVTEASRSPMNPKQWLCRLTCGHEIWRTSTRKPKRFHCGLCKFEQMKADGKFK